MRVTPTRKKIGRYEPGQPFNLEARAARALILRGMLKAVDDDESVEISERTGLPKRQYRRRDMSAETI